MESKDINLLSEAWAYQVNKQIVHEAEELDDEQADEKESPFPAEAVRDLVKASLNKGYRLKVNTKKGAYNIEEYLGAGKETRFIGSQPGGEDVTIHPKDIMSIIGMEKMAFDVMKSDEGDFGDDEEEDKPKDAEQQAAEVMMRAGALSQQPNSAQSQQSDSAAGAMG